MHYWSLCARAALACKPFWYLLDCCCGSVSKAHLVALERAALAKGIIWKISWDKIHLCDSSWEVYLREDDPREDHRCDEIGVEEVPLQNQDPSIVAQYPSIVAQEKKRLVLGGLLLSWKTMVSRLVIVAEFQHRQVVAPEPERAATDSRRKRRTLCTTQTRQSPRSSIQTRKKKGLAVATQTEESLPRRDSTAVLRTENSAWRTVRTKQRLAERTVPTKQRLAERAAQTKQDPAERTATAVRMKLRAPKRAATTVHTEESPPDELRHHAVFCWCHSPFSESLVDG